MSRSIISKLQHETATLSTHNIAAVSLSHYPICPMTNFNMQRNYEKTISEEQSTRAVCCSNNRLKKILADMIITKWHEI
jgi:hypothetical protein